MNRFIDRVLAMDPLVAMAAATALGVLYANLVGAILCLVGGV